MSFISTSRIIQVRNDLELLLILAKRDISVRYKQTILGIIWAIIKPLVTMSVFLFAFKNVSNIQDLGGYPIQLVIFSGVLFWNFFANTFQFSSNSILTNSNLISKVYFPRIIIPISAISVPFIDFIIGTCADDRKFKCNGRNTCHDPKSIYVSSKFYCMDWHWTWRADWSWTFNPTIKISVHTIRRVRLSNRCASHPDSTTASHWSHCWNGHRLLLIFSFTHHLD